MMCTPTHRPPCSPREAGSGTVLALALVLVLLVLMAALLLLVQAGVAAQRAATAADLAALAGADAARGLAPGEPCEVAQAVAVRQQVAMVSCRVSGADRDMVEVVTNVALPNAWGISTGRARAGPPP